MWKTVRTPVWGGTLVTLALGSTGCENPSQPDFPTFFQAKVLAVDSVTTYTGTGNFDVGPDPTYNVDQRFQLASRATSGPDDERISMVLSGQGRPPEGEYELGLMRRSGGALVGFRALYTKTSEEAGIELFASTSGWVRITLSRSDRVDGEFRFTGKLVCENAPGVVWRGYECDTNVPRPDGAEIVLEGSFSAGLPDPDAIRTDDER